MIGAIAAACFFAGTGTARETVGAYRGWGVFRDDAPRVCYAVARPADPLRGASVAVGTWPGRAAGQLHVRFARAARPGSAVLLTIDDRVFQLRGRGAQAWAPDAATDRAILAAMRTGVDMSARARDTDGRQLFDRYALTGAASAIDAAALACRTR